MTWQIIKQPDSRLAVFSTNVNGWIAEDLTPDEVEELFAGDMAADLARRLRAVRRLTALVLAGEIDEAYPITGMTYEQAAACVGYDPDGDDEDEEA